MTAIPETDKEKVKIFALETIGNLLEVVNDRAEEEKILRSFFVHYAGYGKTEMSSETAAEAINRDR